MFTASESRSIKPVFPSVLIRLVKSPWLTASAADPTSSIRPDSASSVLLNVFFISSKLPWYCPVIGLSSLPFARAFRQPDTSIKPVSQTSVTVFRPSLSVSKKPALPSTDSFLSNSPLAAASMTLIISVMSCHSATDPRGWPIGLVIGFADTSKSSDPICNVSLLFSFSSEFRPGNISARLPTSAAASKPGMVLLSSTSAASNIETAAGFIKSMEPLTLKSTTALLPLAIAACRLAFCSTLSLRLTSALAIWPISSWRVAADVSMLVSPVAKRSRADVIFAIGLTMDCRIIKVTMPAPRNAKTHSQVVAVTANAASACTRCVSVAAEVFRSLAINPRVSSIASPIMRARDTKLLPNTLFSST